MEVKQINFKNTLEELKEKNRATMKYVQKENKKYWFLSSPVAAAFTIAIPLLFGIIYFSEDGAMSNISNVLCTIPIFIVSLSYIMYRLIKLKQAKWLFREELYMSELEDAKDVGEFLSNEDFTNRKIANFYKATRGKFTKCELVQGNDEVLLDYCSYVDNDIISGTLYITNVKALSHIEDGIITIDVSDKILVTVPIVESKEEFIDVEVNVG